MALNSRKPSRNRAVAALGGQGVAPRAGDKAGTPWQRGHGRARTCALARRARPRRFSISRQDS